MSRAPDKQNPDYKLHTAGELHILLWHYFSPEPYPHPSPFYDQTKAKYKSLGLLNDQLKVTERACIFVGMLLRTPLPINQWIDPRVII